MHASRILACLVAVLAFAVAWFAFNPRFEGALASNRAAAASNESDAHASSTRRGEAVPKGWRGMHGPSTTKRQVPSYEDMLAELGALTTPEAQERAEAERLARDRATYRALLDKPNPSEIDLSVMRALEEQSRYPSNNQRFALAQQDPVLARREVEQRLSKSPDGSMHLTVSTDSAQYAPGSVIKLRATLLSNGSENSNAPLPVNSELRATLRREGEEALATFALVPSEPGVHLAEVDTRAVAGAPLGKGLYFINVETREGLTQSAAFVMRPAYGRLTGRYRDHAADGALIVEAEIEALEQGDYYVLASLYADDGSPVGSSEVRHTLMPGRHFVPIRFQGKLIHDSGRPGPYRLAHVQLDKLSFPVLEGEHADPDFWTQKYSQDAFDPSPYNPLEEENDEAN